MRSLSDGSAETTEHTESDVVASTRPKGSAKGIKFACGSRPHFGTTPKMVKLQEPDPRYFTVRQCCRSILF
ncbi:hypothetical protein ACFFQF_22185 [Haladaptatus pallidirubidus]|uniref:hypothetical protein n=1 Tax=Haladaptatus pallidirubidus TaxID=1008152 RepID=UPI001D106109|nr:hypothetical protein [Haladaptatus pallidirubidus]